MKTKAFQSKRRPKKGFRALYAKTRKRKQRVSAAAAGGDFAGEEPNLGVARALIVILILHVAAIVAIVVHNSRQSELAIKESPAVKPSQKANVVARTKQVAESDKIAPGEPYAYVNQGDTYERFARRHNVNVQELRRLNNNTPLKYGLALRMPEPAAQIVAPPLPAIAQRVPDPIIQESLPPVVEVPARHGLPTEYEVVEAAQPILPQIATLPEPFPETTLPVPEVRVSPPIVVERVSEPLPVPAPAPVVVAEVKPEPVAAPKPELKPKTKSYTIVKGDTLWAIANRNGISVDKLISANRGINPKKMRPGIQVQIPSR